MVQMFKNQQPDTPWDMARLVKVNRPKNAENEQKSTEAG
jgi:hypothetical protein